MQQETAFLSKKMPLWWTDGVHSSESRLENRSRGRLTVPPEIATLLAQSPPPKHQRDMMAVKIGWMGLSNTCQEKNGLSSETVSQCQMWPKEPQSQAPVVSPRQQKGVNCVDDWQFCQQWQWFALSKVGVKTPLSDCKFMKLLFWHPNGQMPNVTRTLE